MVKKSNLAEEVKLYKERVKRVAQRKAAAEAAGDYSPWRAIAVNPDGSDDPAVQNAMRVRARLEREKRQKLSASTSKAPAMPKAAKLNLSTFTLEVVSADCWHCLRCDHLWYCVDASAPPQQCPKCRQRLNRSNHAHH